MTYYGLGRDSLIVECSSCRSNRLAEEFKSKILLSPEETLPVMCPVTVSAKTMLTSSIFRNLEGASFVHMRHGKLIVVAISRGNANAFLILKYLHNLVEVTVL